MSKPHLYHGLIEDAFLRKDFNFAVNFVTTYATDPSNALCDLASYQISTIKKEKRLDWHARSNFIAYSIQRLITIGANPKHHEKTEADESPIFYAVTCSSPEVVHLLLASGASAEISDSCGSTLIDWCMNPPATRPNQCNEWQSEITDLLIRFGAKPMHHDRGGPTLLLAANNNICNMVKYLLEQGADPNWMSSNGATPLINATRNAQTEAIRVLLGFGADPQLKKSGSSVPYGNSKSPLEMAKTQQILPDFPHKEESLKILNLYKFGQSTGIPF